MTLDVTCHVCAATFEVELADLLEDSTLECPSCEARASKAAVDGVTGVLDDLFTQLSALNRKFTLSFEVDGGDLPAGYEREDRRAAPEEADEDEDSDAADEDGWEEETSESERKEDEER
jgi:hypothetical protein